MTQSSFKYSFFNFYMVPLSLWVIALVFFMSDKLFKKGDGIDFENMDKDDDTNLVERFQGMTGRSQGDVQGIKSNVTFDDVLGIDDFKEELQEIVDYLKRPTEFETMGAQLPKGVLMAGPPGTGKTMLAKAIAGESGCSFFYMSGAQFDQMWVCLDVTRSALEQRESGTCSTKRGLALLPSSSSMRSTVSLLRELTSPILRL